MKAVITYEDGHTTTVWADEPLKMWSDMEQRRKAGIIDVRVSSEPEPRCRCDARAILDELVSAGLVDEETLAEVTAGVEGGAA